jgi:hypothetical protein
MNIGIFYLSQAHNKMRFFIGNCPNRQNPNLSYKTYSGSETAKAETSFNMENI